MNESFALDKGNARVLGVCSGLAKAWDMDPMVVRLFTLVLGLYLAPLVILLYLLIAFTASQR